MDFDQQDEAAGSQSEETVVACALGHRAYAPTWSLQKRLQQRLIDAKRQDHVLPHILLLVEHPPVYTLGKSGDSANLLLDKDDLAERGASFHEIDRGGDITYHGPGQLVAYPLLDLDRLFTDLGRYLRTLEEVIIRTCADYDLRGRRVEGRTGVWIGPDEHGPERKICAMGIRCSRWVTMHGLALNVNTDLRYFDHIVPCGIDDRGVTSLQREVGERVDERDLRTRLLKHFSDCFAAKVRFVKQSAASDTLSTFLDEEAAPSHSVLPA